MDKTTRPCLWSLSSLSSLSSSSVESTTSLGRAALLVLLAALALLAFLALLAGGSRGLKNLRIYLPKSLHSVWFGHVLNDEGNQNVNEHVHELCREAVLALKLHGQPENKSHVVAA